MNKPLHRSAPEAMGVDPAGIVRFADAVEAAGLELHGFMVLRRGAVVAEGYWKPYGPEHPHMLFSLSKSFTSTAVGFAVDEGLLRVDDPVLKFFPEDAPEKPGRNWAEMKVRHLLTMTTGHDRDTTAFMMRRRDGNWAKGFLLQPVKHRPGTHFLYNTGATYMLSAIVQKLTGQRVLDYLTPRLFSPLGIGGATWEQCPGGVDTGGFGLSLRTEDIAKFGQFLLQRGVWEGRRLLGAEWIDEATGKRVENGPADGTTDWGEGYGYQFWRCVPDCYRGDGAFGQFCVVVPRLDMVVAVTSGLGDMQAVLTRLWEHVLPAAGEPMPENLPARRAMADRLAALRYDPPQLQAHGEEEARLNGATLKLEKNPERIRSFTLAFGPDTCKLTCRTTRGVTEQAFGFNRWNISRVEERQTLRDDRGRHTELAGAFGWEADGTLVLTSRDLRGPFVLTRRLRFDGDAAVIQSKLNVSFGPTDLPEMRGTVMR